MGSSIISVSGITWKYVQTSKITRWRKEAQKLARVLVLVKMVGSGSVFYYTVFCVIVGKKTRPLNSGKAEDVDGFLWSEWNLLSWVFEVHIWI